MANALDENWELLLTLFPLGWEQQAILSGALERLRGFDSAADLLRVLLLHVGKGYSLRETVVRGSPMPQRSARPITGPEPEMPLPEGMETWP